jgi:hydroxymethylpyrimidine pyrophosphatase-like HAD family hydrolase
MRFAAIAIDYDGTLATLGRVAPATLQALTQLAGSGRKLVLVTGRELDELLGIFPEIDVFDRVVAENGALLYTPATRTRRTLGEAPPPAFVRELARRGVAPLSVGETIVATVHPNENVVLEVIRDLGLELQVIFNKGAVMVLPASINKASGLKAALEELGLSLRNTAAIGDAENDHALLRAAEYGVAVANAVPMLQREADRISTRENGAAVIELARDLAAHDLNATPPRAPRRQIALGARTDGTGLNVSPAWTNILVTGSSGSGKSSFVAGVLERLAAEGYQFCVFDPEGDYAELPDAIVFGNADRGPGVAEVFTALEKPEANVVMNLIGLPLADRPQFFSAMLPRLEALRARTGRPHWIVIDEAHHLMPQDSARREGAERDAMAGALLVTVHPESVDAAMLRAMDLALVFGESPGATLQQFGRAAGLGPLEAAAATLRPAEALLWSRDAGQGAEVIRVAPSRAERRRHRRKYAEGELPPERSFHFRGPQRRLNLRAQNLVLFLQIGEGVDEETWLHHLRAGDYSRWVRASIKDEALADELATVERDDSVGVDQGRARIRAAVEQRYTLPATGDGPA